MNITYLSKSIVGTNHKAIVLIQPKPLIRFVSR